MTFGMALSHCCQRFANNTSFHYAGGNLRATQSFLSFFTQPFAREHQTAFYLTQETIPKQYTREEHLKNKQLKDFLAKAPLDYNLLCKKSQLYTLKAAKPFPILTWFEAFSLGLSEGYFRKRRKWHNHLKNHHACRTAHASALVLSHFSTRLPLLDRQDLTCLKTLVCRKGFCAVCYQEFMESTPNYGPKNAPEAASDQRAHLPKNSLSYYHFLNLSFLLLTKFASVR